MKVIGIVGSRSRNTLCDQEDVGNALLEVYNHGDEIVSGGSPLGGDHFAEWFAKTDQIPIKIYYAEWNRLGRSAGFARNGKIAYDADVLIACVSKTRTGGTEDTIKKFLTHHPNGKVILA